MHYLLAGRIQRILRRVHHERGGRLSLEFLHDCPTDVARGYLLSLEGFGVKTVSCILLLALYRADFPVDVNVGRIMARLGWVPLETEEALEELSVYAPEPAVYTFLRERLNSFGLQTLFEMHYHMITLGKVFCEKRCSTVAHVRSATCEYAISAVNAGRERPGDGNDPNPGIRGAPARLHRRRGILSRPRPPPPVRSAAVAAGSRGRRSHRRRTTPPRDNRPRRSRPSSRLARRDASGRPSGHPPCSDSTRARIGPRLAPRTLVSLASCTRISAPILAPRGRSRSSPRRGNRSCPRCPRTTRTASVDEETKPCAWTSAEGHRRRDRVRSEGGSGDGGSGDIEDAFAGTATKGLRARRRRRGRRWLRRRCSCRCVPRRSI